MNQDTLKSLIFGFIGVSIIGAIYLAFISPIKLELVFYKIILISIALSLTYLCDIAFFPHQQPSELIKLIDRKGEDEIEDKDERRGMYILLAAINIRRSIIIAGFLLAFMTGI